MSAVPLRFSRIHIEHLSWQEFVKRYDRLQTFFYMDPPYYLAPYYKHNMDLPDYEEMASLLAGIQGKFLLSINDTPEMREVFQAFTVEPVTLRYTVAREAATTGKELLIRNFG